MSGKKKKDKQKLTENNLKKPEKLDDETLGQVTGGLVDNVVGRTHLNELMTTVTSLENTDKDK